VRSLVVDVGTTSIRSAIVDEDGEVSHVNQERLAVSSPAPGEVELDAGQIARLSLELATRSLADGGPCDVVGVANQRATTILFDPANSRPVGPAIGWQDLRTVVDCLVLQGSGVRLAPNQSATKAKWLLESSGRPGNELRFATIETWVAWHLSGGSSFVTDHSNAAVNGLVTAGATEWDHRVLDALGLDPAMLAAIVPTMGDHGRASALAGSPSIRALVGDQSASLLGQGCVEPGPLKITLGTGAMLDRVHQRGAPTSATRLASGCFPIVARSDDNALTWGVEAIALSAGTCVEWLRDGIGLVTSAEETESLAGSVDSSDGVTFVPALLGLGTPKWDFGARGALFGLTRGSTRAHIVRAVLEGVAMRCADLVDAAVAETGEAPAELRVDGGMSANSVLVGAIADATGLSVAVSREREATTRGAGLMALVAAGAIELADVQRSWSPSHVVEPSTSADRRVEARAKWADMVERAAGTIPELSSVSF
jgi:glycerol kinase